MLMHCERAGFVRVCRRRVRRLPIPTSASDLAPPWPPATLLLHVGLAGSALMVTLWLVALRTRKAAIVDPGWSCILGAAAVYYALVGTGSTTQRVLTGTVGGLWSLRLTWHLLRDRILGRPEDGRYAAMRHALGRHADLHFLWFFLAQAWLAALLSLPFWFLAHTPGEGLAPVQGLGLLVFAGALLGEAIADRQLARFRGAATNRGMVCDRGLWRWSRHPNYFAEWLVWIAFALLAAPSPHGLWAWSAPLLMLVLITKVTGIPYTEAQALRSRGARYRAYQARTSAFFPWPPRPGAPDRASRPR
jgi:steroid 5-alpha reductase family enzyme